MAELITNQRVSLRQYAAEERLLELTRSFDSQERGIALAYARGGPRSVCEEKPELVNVTGATWQSRSVTARGGRSELVETVAPVRGWPGVQQSMGHLVSSAEADTAEVDFAGAAWWWWCSCIARSQLGAEASAVWHETTFPVPVHAAAISGESNDESRAAMVVMERNRRMMPSW